MIHRMGFAPLHPFDAAVVTRAGGGPSIPEALVIESISRGVLDTRLRGMAPVCRAVVRSIA